MVAVSWTLTIETLRNMSDFFYSVLYKDADKSWFQIMPSVGEIMSVERWNIGELTRTGRNRRRAKAKSQFVKHKSHI